MVSMFTSVRSDRAPMVSRGFVFMLWLISVVAPGSEPSDELYSMLDQFAVVWAPMELFRVSSRPQCRREARNVEAKPRPRPLWTAVAALDLVARQNVAPAAVMARFPCLS